MDWTILTTYSYGSMTIGCFLFMMSIIHGLSYLYAILKCSCQSKNNWISVLLIGLYKILKITAN